MNFNPGVRQIVGVNLPVWDCVRINPTYLHHPNLQIRLLVCQVPLSELERVIRGVRGSHEGVRG